jgi:hypothetical protein
VLAERVLLGGEVHEVEVGAVLAVPVLRSLADEERLVSYARLASASLFVSKMTIVTWMKLRAFVGIRTAA